MTRAALTVMVVGAAGRMGSLTAETVAAQPDLELVAAVDPAFTQSEGGRRFTSVEAALAAVTPDVAVDFTVPAAVFETVAAALRAGVHAVVGATGLGSEQIDQLDAIRAQTGANLFVAPNFALGAVLLMELSKRAARYFPAVEIVELHHDQKVDAPSGTALRTARLIVEARGAREARPEAGPAATSGAGQDSPAGPADEPPSRGLMQDQTHIHSIRLPGLVAHQEVLFGGSGELLTIRHDSFSRDSFMRGVLLAIRRVGTLNGTVVGLEHLLESSQ